MDPLNEKGRIGDPQQGKGSWQGHSEELGMYHMRKWMEWSCVGIKVEKREEESLWSPERKIWMSGSKKLWPWLQVPQIGGQEGQNHVVEYRSTYAL